MIVQPFRGGMNVDDDIENMPPNDYEHAENLMLSIGDKKFSKLYGTESIHNITGSCFGIFEFAEYTVLFIDNGSGTGNYPHEVYLVYEDDTVEKIFWHEFELDTSIQLISCKLVNNEMLIFNNAVDEVMRLHIGMSSVAVNYSPSQMISTGFIISEYFWDGNNLSIRNFQTPINPDTTKLYVVSTNLSEFQQYSLISNNIFNGYVSNDGSFIITTSLPKPYGLDGRTVVVKEFSEDYIAYRKTSTKDYYLINTPPLDPPELEFLSDSGKTQNKLKNNVFQFQAKYVYWDNTESAWSPISKTLVDDSFGFLEYDNNNGISISVKHPEQYDRGNVKEVVFGVRINEGLLYEFDRKPVVKGDANFFSTNIEEPIQTTFYNDEVLLPIVEVSANNQFDWIGERVGDIELIDDSTLALSNNQLPRVDVNPIVSLSYITKNAEVSQSDDWFFAYRYFYTSTSATTLQSNNDIESKGKQYMPSVDPHFPYSWDVSNKNAKGEITEPISGAISTATLDETIAEAVTEGKSTVDREREFGYPKAYAYFDFSPVQEVGTIYNVDIKLYRRHPSTGSLDFIRSADRDFLASTTDTQDLLDNITDWVENKSGLNGFFYGTDNIETFARSTNDTFFNEFSGITPRSNHSLQISSGLQCTHNDPGHYHWYQVDRLEVTITKVSATNYIRKTLKNQAKHLFGFKYVDGFGRTMSQVKIGEIDLSDEDALNKLYEGEIKISHLAPPKAKRCHLLYAGNKNYNNFIYAVVSEVTPPVSGNEVEIKLNFEPYNDDYGANLSYSFTKGDVIQRLASSDGNTYTELEDKKAYRVLRESAGGEKIMVEYDVSNEFEVNDLVVIHSPKLEVDDENTLYYESGIVLEVENRAHRSPDGSQLVNEGVTAAIRFQEGSDLSYGEIGSTEMYIISFLIPDNQTGLDQNTQFEILNTKYKGFYPTQQFYPNFQAGFHYVEVSFPIQPNLGDAVPLPFDEDYIYITWEGATETTYNNVYQRQAYLKLQNFGDAYLRWRDANYDHLVESYSMSDLFDSKFWGKGRPVIVGENDAINSGGIVQYSQPYFLNTDLNGIATFHARDYQEYSTVNGDIKRILEYGERLLLIKDRELSSTLIGKDEVQTGDGNTLQTTAAITLSPNERQYIYTGGIGNQVYSLVKFNNNVYLADPHSKAFLRIAQNGVTTISEVKMDSYFDELFNDKSVQIYSSFNRQNYEVILHIKSDTENKQLIWNEPRTRWVSFWGIDCERMIYDNRILSFNANELFKHTSSARNNIYGSQVISQIIKTVSTDTKNMWYTMMLSPLFINRQLDIETEEGQESNLLPNNFEKDGRGFWAAFLKDTTTPNVANPILNGHDLQSRILTLKLENDSQDDDKLGDIGVTFDSVE